MAEDQAIKDLFGSDSDEDDREIAASTAEEDVANGDTRAEDQVRELFGSDDEDLEGKEEDDRVKERVGEASLRQLEEERASPVRQEKMEEREKREENGDGREYGPPMKVAAALLDAPQTSTLRVAKLSNILAVEPEAFDPNTYQLSQVEYLDDRGQKRVRLSHENAIRWRWATGPDGGLVRESNARIVEWSDGSRTLSVGDEVFDVREIDISGEHTFLYARIPNLIQAQGRLEQKFVFRPASLSSGTHRRLASVLDRHSVRKQKVRATTTLVDPKKEKEEREREEEARIRYKERLAEKQTKQLRRYTGLSAGGRHVSAGYTRPSMLSAAYLEEEEDEDLDDDFIVKDDEEVDEEYQESEEEVEEEEEGDEDERDLPFREDDTADMERNLMIDEDEAARRLSAAKASAPPPPTAQSGRRVLADSESEDDDMRSGGRDNEGQADKSNIKTKRKRAVVMESDSDE